MKKIHLLMAAVLVTATLSAFTSKKTDPIYYRDADGFHEKTTSGICAPDVYNCEYEWVGLGNPSDPQDENNYQATGDASKVFIPSPNVK